jgi:hypothetical protein
MSGRYRPSHRCGEYAYDRQSKVGKLDKAKAKGWTIVDVKQDWKKVFAFER